MLYEVLLLLVGFFIGVFAGIGGAVWLFKKQMRNINPSNMIENVMGQMFGVEDDKDEMKDKQTYDDWIK